ncbi:RusA family crossover junction endodeoxyribonuclease [Neorhizobium galegae]|uniref:RusA family crossover junction endodeoxyribonuclease n=1 Tax=Neorhizobium galegae TaxID=399 RepID=UPI0006214296|nr:RusA family crossover junction endodeoxyribonuclease [Neorhizobium galegae]CDZ55036.1 Endodeoxyribonuclease RusA [Neorhizobium galegae bv. orientalis]
MIEIVLAGPPMGKERVRSTRQGHVYTPERTVNYEGRLAYAAQEVMGDRPPLDGALEVDICCYMAVPESKPKKWKAAALSGAIRPTKKPDYDNFAKICDALNLIVWVDDAQVVDGRIRKFYSDRPRMEIRVTPITDEEGVFG